MKHLTVTSNSVLSTIVFTTLLIFSGCTGSSQELETDNKKDAIIKAENDLEVAKEEYRAEVAQFRIEYNQRIAANEREILMVKENIKTSEKDVKAEYKDQLDMFEKRNAELKKKLDDYNDEDMNKWQTFKAEFSRDVNELGEAFGDFTTKDNN